MILELTQEFRIFLLKNFPEKVKSDKLNFPETKYLETWRLIAILNDQIIFYSRYILLNLIFYLFTSPNLIR